MLDSMRVSSFAMSEVAHVGVGRRDESQVVTKLHFSDERNEDSERHVCRLPFALSISLSDLTFLDPLCVDLDPCGNLVYRAV